MSDSNALEGLTEALRRLPGVGVKSAARMAFHLLQNDKPGALQIAKADRKSTRLNSSHVSEPRLPSSA